EVLEHLARPAGRLQGLAQHDIVERVLGIGGEVAVGVALDDAKPVPDTGIDAGLAQFDAARVDRLLPRQIAQQRPVAAADIEHARARLDHRGDQLEVAAQLPARRGRGDAEIEGRGGHGLSPRCSAQPARKPRSVANSSGSCSRKASWPLSVSISTKLTFAATAFSACTSSRLSEVGNSQSLVNEMMQNRALVPAKAAGSDPSCSAARSK